MSTTTTAKTLREVTRAEPCEACGKPDWCARSAEDGSLRCMRPELSQTPHGYRVQTERDREGGIIYKPERASSNGQHPTASAAKPKRGKLHDTPERAAEAAAWAIEQKRGERWAHSSTWSYRRDGIEYARALRFDSPDGSDKTFMPIHRDGEGWRVGDPPTWHPYRVDELPADGVVFIVEGEKCADALASIGIAVTTSAHGSKSPHKTDWRALAGRDVVIWPDHDEPGKRYAEAVVSMLAKLDLPATVRIIDPPDELPEGGDVADYIDARECVEPDELRAGIEAMADEAREHEPGAASGGEQKAEIQITTAEHRVVEETIEAMRADADLYQRGGGLVRVVRDDGRGDGVERPAGTPTIREAPAAHLRERITRVAKYERFDMRAETWMPTHPPGWLVSAIAERGEWAGIRPLVGVSDAPVLRPDGSIWQTRGYDVQTATLYEPGAVRFEPVPDNITREAAHAAALRLLDVVSDFPFATEAHRAAWLAALLTPLARSAFTGPAPLFLADANVRGSGKTLAMRVAGRINTGRELPVAGYAHDPEEMRKKITATAIAGDRLVLLDNLAGPFGNDALDRALTSTQWSDRILGKSQRVELPLLTTWYATGNNVQVAADTARRIIHIRLDVLDEHPEHRAGFAHPDLMRHVTAERPRLLVDALTVLAGYLRAGKPTLDLQPFGSFEGWSATVRAAVVWAGLPDPCETQETLAESDTTADALGQLLTAWQRYDVGGAGFTAGELVRRLYPPRGEHWPMDDDTAAMRSAVEAVTGATPSKPPGARQLGNRLKQHRRRVLAGCYIDATPTGREGLKWHVLRV